MTPPGELPLRKLLAICAADPSGAVEELKELLLLLHAPDNLEGCVKVASNLTYTLKAALANRPSQDYRARIERFQRANEWLCLNAKQLEPELYLDDAGRERFSRDTGPNPMMGCGAGEHGLWTLHWETILLPTWRPGSDACSFTRLWHTLPSCVTGSWITIGHLNRARQAGS